MGAPTRPTKAITYSQAREYETSRVKWYNFYGHITNIKELAMIYKIPHMTLCKRLKAGWPLEAALLADPKQQWTINNIQFFQEHITTKQITDILEAYLYPKESKTKNGKNGVIDGGAF